MADLARGQLRRKRSALILALDGRLEEHHRFLLALRLRRLEAAEQDIAALDERLAVKLQPYREQHAVLMQIPGVDWLVAAVLIAEIGTDMSVFNSASHLAAWAGVSPGNHETASKQKSGRAREGNVHLSTMLVGRPSPLRAPRAAISRTSTIASRPAAARCVPLSPSPTRILVAAYHIVAKGLAYRDLGDAYLDQIAQTRTVANLKRRLERLGYSVTLEPNAAAV